MAKFKCKDFTTGKILTSKDNKQECVLCGNDRQKILMEMKDGYNQEISLHLACDDSLYLMVVGYSKGSRDSKSVRHHTSIQLHFCPVCGKRLHHNTLWLENRNILLCRDYVDSIIYSFKGFKGRVKQKLGVDNMFTEDGELKPFCLMSKEEREGLEEADIDISCRKCSAFMKDCIPE